MKRDFVTKIREPVELTPHASCIEDMCISIVEHEGTVSRPNTGHTPSYDSETSYRALYTVTVYVRGWQIRFGVGVPR